MRPSEAVHAGVTEVHTLVCQSHVDFAGPCLKSLQAANPSIQRIIVHDDGSLAPEAEDVLKRFVPNMKLIRRSVADEKIEEILANYPRCRSYRVEHALALKLLDTILISPEPVTAFCDTDVLFYQKAEGFFDLPADVDAIFMCDMYNSYSLRSWQILRHRVACCSYVNTGAYVVRRSVLDLDRLEWLLGIAASPVLNHYREQTAWACLAAMVSTALWHPDDVRIVTTDSSSHSLIAGHYVSTYREKLFSDLARNRGYMPNDRDGRGARLLAARRCSAFEVLKYEVWRRVTRNRQRSYTDPYQFVTGDLASRRVT